MRALLGVLRSDEDAADGDRQPGRGGGNGRRDWCPARPGRRRPGPGAGTGGPGRLAERTSGVRVDLDIAGDRPALPAGLELAAYRVIQEAVTNVIKHAAADCCRVRVACPDGALTLEVTDDGDAGPSAGQRAGQSASPAPGHGIAGMQERVGMYGGEFRAGPLPGRGFRVTARFPLPVPAA